jgi:hypothetical protein
LCIILELKGSGIPADNSWRNPIFRGGMDIMLTRNLAFSLMPQYRIALKSSNQGSPVNTFPNSFTIMTALKISR